MKWNFDGPNGGVTVRQEGERAVCQAISGHSGGGLYKAWLLGPGGKVLLGTMIPDGGALRLRRVLEIAWLEARGAWPPTGAEISLGLESGPPHERTTGWRWVEQPGKLVGDKEIARMLKKAGRALYNNKEREGFLLALPYAPGEPYPLPALFCLSSLEQINEKWYAVFPFSVHGYPQLMHIFSASGENREGT